ncbi:penicillin-insensitive murein endopeptidase [Veronia nyctiphanis]|uniref:penicillin-insensitive murein endopeptidase n=1 Tax=Veronia nyctiphanis TaxID=1278244 RepID=UPI002E258F56
MRQLAASPSTLIKTAALDSRTERIFVHPVIKEKLCSEATGNRNWLRKVRPWFGHNYHMHVRLKCPEGDKRCISQALPPPGDGCGAELISWRPQPGKKDDKPPVKKKRKIKPFECLQLVDG